MKNNIREIPKSLLKIPSLKEIQVSDNPLLESSIKILKRLREKNVDVYDD